MPRNKLSFSLSTANLTAFVHFDEHFCCPFANKFITVFFSEEIWECLEIMLRNENYKWMFMNFETLFRIKCEEIIREKLKNPLKWKIRRGKLFNDFALFVFHFSSIFS